jgi:hypothetical protein
MNKYFSKQKILLFFLAISIVAVFWMLAKNWAFPDTHWETRKDEKVSLEAGQALVQKFSASRDNLKQIEILFANSKIGNGAAVKVQIFSENCFELLREKSFQVSFLDSEEVLNFSFRKISDAREKVFCLKLVFEPKDQKKKAKVYIVENNNPENITLFDTQKNRVLPEKSLSMRPGYQADNWRENIQELNQRISQYKPWFLKHYFLFFIAFAFILLSIVMVVILILV